MSVGEGGFSFPSDAEQEQRGPLMAIADVQIAYRNLEINPLRPKFIKTQTEVSNEDGYLDIDRRRRAWGKCREGGSVIYSVSSDALKFCTLNMRTAFQE